jgi:hypothetical protein
MTNIFSTFSWLGILLAFIAYSIIGALWFAVLFRKHYLAALGRPLNEPQSKDPIYFVGPMVCNLVVILTSAWLMHQLNIATAGAAIPFALVVGLGYLVTNTVNIGINPNIPHPLRYGIISGSCHLVAIVVACVILVSI